MKNQFLTFVQNDLSRVNEQKILFFFYAIGLQIFCSTLCAKFEKNRTESNEVAIRIMYLKTNTDGVNAIGSSSQDSCLKMTYLILRDQSNIGT